MEKKTMRPTQLTSVLQQLLDHADLTSNGLAKILRLPTPTIHRLLTGEVQDPRISTMTFIADYFGTTIEQLLGRADLDDHFYAENSRRLIKPAASIPLLTMSEAHTLRKYVKEPSAWFRWQSNTDQADDEKIFAIAIKNNLYEPLFTHSTIIIINPKIDPENGDYVLVHFEGDSIPVLKRYLSEGRNKYFSTVNTDVKTIKFDPAESKIMGVVIESYNNFKN